VHPSAIWALALSATTTHSGAAATQIFTNDFGIFWATVALAVVTAAMSIATFSVAKKTATLARETLDASTLADIHTRSHSLQ
jgi:hypothetical protein